MEIKTEQVKSLRDRTGISVMQCKKALEEANGNVEKAIVILQKKSGAIADKKAGRELKAGAVQAYVHSTGDVGAMVTLSCETDFVSKNKDFIVLAYDIAMHVAALNPLFLKKEDINADAVEKVKEVFASEIKNKAGDMKEKILNGKLDSYFKDKILLEQSFIKNPEQTIKNMIESAIQKFGEKIEITDFIRYSVR
jgi:elongation factor Ts